MSKDLFIGFVKLIFLYVPISAVIFIGCYFCDVFLIDHNLRRFVFVPIVLSIALLLFLFKLMFGASLEKMKRLH
jgi:hypothetical protein